MLTSNTMRFGTDSFGEFERLPRLMVRINNQELEIEMTDFQVSSPSIVVRIKKKNYYIRLVEPTTAVASPLRIKIEGNTYALANTA